ncbi:toprim domain-containing protein [Pelobacter propionicus]|uniref:TOPRIM domain protein n=1 Tax=Pelobacter propionicus (strain DSM 2379 / NBRC 103807 / OttBd1) TaxID=338966 RepID=A1AQW8_PELPD|nr:toprim domain-containing protein [Pelobacter propionicus]ABK99738.1 TOPRIM domain protein [Pelobacter propionicus DSM 2379]
MNNPIDGFRQFMRNAGLEPPGEIVANGSLNRFTVPGDKPRSLNGWYVFHADTPAAGSFGCWKRQLNETWSAKEYHSMDPAEKAAYSAKMETIKRQREEEQVRIHAECRAWCADVWGKAEDATNDHPYLKAKGVKSFGLKCFRGSLLIPIQDIAGNIYGMQFIRPDGSKTFKTGTAKRGHFYSMGEGKGNTLCIAEGYATAASIHQATGYPVLTAFDAGNLKPVAENVRAKVPQLNIIICADNDQWTEGNPGLTKATEAARAVGGLLAVPFIEGVRHE